MDTATIAARLAAVLHDVQDCAARAGRAADSVRVLAVSKFHPQQAVLDAYGAGQRLFGENRVQEAAEKFSTLPDAVAAHCELHLIGTLHKNKVKHAVRIASCIESVDRLSLLAEIERHCAARSVALSVLFEYRTGEDSKSGFTEQAELEAALEYCAAGAAPHITPRGSMTMAPFTDDEHAIRKSFSTLRILAEKMRAHYPSLPLSELSMGMTNDYRYAIAEGSTEVRIGTAIFGEREYAA